MGVKEKILAVICFCAVFSNCSKAPGTTTASTSGVKLYGDRYGEILRSFKPTADGGYVFGGYTITSAYLGEQGFIQKTDKNGNLSWFQTYGGPNQEIFNIVQPTSDGGFIAAGSSGPDYYHDSAYIVKTDGEGTVIWQKYFPGYLLGAYFHDVKETPDHGFVAIGYCYAYAENPLYIVRLDQSGDSLWTRKIVDSVHNQIGASVAVGPNGEIAIASALETWSDSIWHPAFTYLSQYGASLLPQISFPNIGPMPWPENGNTWQWGTSTNYEKIISQPDGFIFVISSDLKGITGNPICHNCGISLSVTLFKVDFSGNILWTHSYDDLGNNVVFNDAVVNPQGGILISGGAVDISNTNYCWLLNTDANGNRVSQYFIPIKGTTTWACGAVNTGNSYAIGVTSSPLLTNRVGFFGFLDTDLNGKIIDESK